MLTCMVKLPIPLKRENTCFQSGFNHCVLSKYFGNGANLSNTSCNAQSRLWSHIQSSFKLVSLTIAVSSSVSPHGAGETTKINSRQALATHGTS